MPEQPVDRLQGAIDTVRSYLEALAGDTGAETGELEDALANLELELEQRDALVDVRRANAALVTSVAEGMADAGKVVKDRENTEHRYKFASVEAMLEAVRLPLLERGVILLARPGNVETTQIQARSGTPGERVEVAFDFEFNGHGASLQIHGWTGVGVDYSDKAYSKAVTSALKTFVRCQWLLPALTDDGDPDQQSPEYGAAASGPDWTRAASDASKREALAAMTWSLGHEGTARQYLTTLAGRTGGSIPEVVALWLATIRQWRAAADKAREEQAAPPGTAERGAATEAADAAEETARKSGAGERTMPPADQFADVGEQICGKSYRGSRNVVCCLKPGHAWPQHYTEGGQAFGDDVARDQPDESRPRLGDPAAAEPAPPAEPDPDPPGEVDDRPAAGTVDIDTDIDALRAEAGDEAALDHLRELGCICSDPFTEEGRDETCPLKGHGIPF